MVVGGIGTPGHPHGKPGKVREFDIGKK